MLFGDFSRLSTIKLKSIPIAIAPFEDLNDKSIIFFRKVILSKILFYSNRFSIESSPSLIVSVKMRVLRKCEKKDYVYFKQNQEKF